MKLLLIDTSALFYRSRSALMRTAGEMTTSFGVPITGTFGFCNALFSVMEKNSYDSVIPCYDKGGNFRKQGDSDYKANRQKASLEHYADLSLLIEDVLPALGFTPVGKKGYEADDVIAHISRNSPAYSEIHILTCDKDLLQLITNKVKVLLFNSSKKMQLVGQEEFTEMYGLEPKQLTLLKALSGDSSDNIQGIKGIGPKTATKIINDSEANSSEDGFSKADRIVMHPKVAPHAFKFLSNLKLVTLENDISELVWYSSVPPDPTQVETLFQGLEFKSFLKESRLAKIFRSLGTTNESQSKQAPISGQV